jgi:hypothetical protein
VRRPETDERPRTDARDRREEREGAQEDGNVGEAVCVPPDR